MLEQIAQVTGLNYDMQDPILNSVLVRIRRKLPDQLPADEEQARAAILEAERAVNQEGQLAIVNLVRALTAERPVRELKIKSSPKGCRLKEAAANGIRYSFGPVWNQSVQRARGIAVAAQNRDKLLHQAHLLGIDCAGDLPVAELCAAIAATF